MLDHSLFAHALSRRSFTKSFPRQPFLHMKILPWYPRSTKPQWSSVLWKACIMLKGFESSPFFSIEDKISLKSPTYTQGKEAWLFKWHMRYHVSHFRWSSRWPYTPINHQWTCIEVVMRASIWLGETIYVVSGTSFFHKSAIPPLRLTLGTAVMESNYSSCRIGSISLTLCFHEKKNLTSIFPHQVDKNLNCMAVPKPLAVPGYGDHCARWG